MTEDLKSKIAETRRASRERFRETFKKHMPISPINSAILLPDGTVQPCHVIDWTLWRSEKGTDELCCIGRDQVGTTEVVTSFCHMDLAHSGNREFDRELEQETLKAMSREQREWAEAARKEWDEHDAKTPPAYFETMIFDENTDSKYRRYETIQQARAGHAEAVAELRKLP